MSAGDESETARPLEGGEHSHEPDLVGLGEPERRALLTWVGENLPELPDFERADRIGEFWGSPKTRTFAELLTDCEEDRTLRAVLVAMLRETEP